MIQNLVNWPRKCFPCFRICLPQLREYNHLDKWRQRLMKCREPRGNKKPTPKWRTETHLSLLTPTSANRCDQFNEACALDLALLSGGEILFQKKHHIVRATLFTAQCLASPLPWTWHAVLCVGTTPPWQVALTPSARATQWASHSHSKSRSQPGSASTRWMKGISRGHSEVPARLWGNQAT